MTGWQIYFLGVVVMFFRYIALWNARKHITMNYAIVAFISLYSWFGVVMTLPHYFIDKGEQKFFDYKLRK